MRCNIAARFRDPKSLGDIWGTDTGVQPIKDVGLCMVDSVSFCLGEAKGRSYTMYKVRCIQNDLASNRQGS